MKCPLCPKTYTGKFNIVTHIELLHDGGKVIVIKCDKCEYETYKKGHMKRHNDAVHLQVKKFKCSLCTHEASLAKNLRTHIQAVHFKIKDFKCTLLQQVSNILSKLCIAR